MKEKIKIANKNKAPPPGNEGFGNLNFIFGILDLVLEILEFLQSLDFLPHSASWSVHKLHTKLTKLTSNAIS